VAADAGAHSIAVYTDAPDSSGMRIKIWEEKGRNAQEIRRLGRMLAVTLAAFGGAAALALCLSVIVGSGLEAQQQELAKQISDIRSTARAGQVAQSESAAAAEQSLVRRKWDTPSPVMVLEALSQLLPDHTYVTELRMEGSKLRLTGVTGDAASLIGLLEQSGRFARVSFFAPSTRSPPDNNERFHIEAVVQPLGTWRS
jgi:general secretion pathway protein L